MIFYNGQTGSLGRYFRFPGTHALTFRLNSQTPYLENFRTLLAQSTEKSVTLMPLAGIVSVPEAEKNPHHAREINVTENLRMAQAFIRAAQEVGKEAALMYVSSGHVYDQVEAPTRLTESHPLKPRSVYAQTKWEAEQVLMELAKSEKVSLQIFRVFGLVAPEQPGHYLLPSLIKRLREKNLKEIPGLPFFRDYLDARDVCQILFDRSARSHSVGVETFNLCSGIPIQIQTVLEQVAQVLQIPAAVYLPLLSVGQKRADDIPWIVGDPSKIEAVLGYKTQKTLLTQTIQDSIQ